MSTKPFSPNPKRVAAGRRNCLKSRGLTPEGRERLRQAALANRPWLASTGPRTAKGKAKASANGKVWQKGERSVPEVRASVAAEASIVSDMMAGRKLVVERLESQR